MFVAACASHGVGASRGDGSRECFRPHVPCCHDSVFGSTPTECRQVTKHFCQNCVCHFTVIFCWWWCFVPFFLFLFFSFQIWNRTRPRVLVQNQHTWELISAWNTQHMSPQSPMVTLTWHACKYRVHKLYQRYILKCKYRGCTSGGVSPVPCIYTHARWELP